MAELILSNKMTGSYNLMAIGQSPIELQYTVVNNSNSQVEIEYGIVGNSSSEIELNYSVIYGGSSQVEIEYVPTVSSIIEIQYEVNPHNRMRARFDLQLPPIVKVEVPPIADSFVASFNPFNFVNYGSNNSMVVGNDDKGSNSSYIKFPTDIVEEGGIVRDAKIRIHYTDLDDDYTLMLARVRSEWDEYNITYRNRPTDVVNVTNQYVNNKDEFYIEIDITELFTEWNDGLLNEGILLTSNKPSATFRTRESFLPPQLIVNYYSPRPVINTNSRVTLEYEVVAIDDSQIEIQYDVHSDYDFSEIELQYFVKAPNEVFVEEIEIQYEVTQKDRIDTSNDIEIQYYPQFDLFSVVELQFEIEEKNDNSEIELEYEVSFNNVSEIELQFKIEEKIDNSEIELIYDVLATHTAGTNQIELQFEIEEKIDNSNIEIQYQVVHNSYDELELQFEIEHKEDSSQVEIEFQIIEVGKSELEFQYEVPFTDDSSQVEIEYVVLAKDSSNVELQFEIESKDSNSNIELTYEVGAYDSSEIELTYEVRINGSDSVTIEYGVPGEDNSNLELQYLVRAEFLSIIEIQYEVNGESSSTSYVYIM